MPGFLSPRKGVPLLLIPEYSGMNKGQRIPDRSKKAHRKPPVKCFLTVPWMFRAALFIIVKKWGEKTHYPWTDEWKSKMQCLHTVEYYYSGIKRNDSLTPATMWVNLESIMLSARRQPQETTWSDLISGFPDGLVVKNLPATCGFDPWVGKIPWRRAWQPTPVFLPGEAHGQKNLAGYSPQGHKGSDTTEAT